MARNFKDVLAGFSPEERAAVKQRKAEIHREHQARQELRRAVNAGEVTFAPFDAAEYLDSQDLAEAYLAEIIALNDAQLLRNALDDVARAGLEPIAELDGCRARIHFDTGDGIFVGRVIAQNDTIGFHGATVADFLAGFAEAAKTLFARLANRAAALDASAEEDSKLF